MNNKSLIKVCLLAVTYVLMLFISGCDTPEKVMKSRDLDLQKAKAISWYNKKEYYKCIPVLEQVIGLMKGRQSTEDLYFMYAMANYNQGDYMISAYHFKYFYDQYPNSEKAEECLYMHCKSYQQLSPKPDLDQTYTLKALDAYQLFLNAYPNSKYLKEVNESVSKMRKKLQKKALNTADLYYRKSDFKAAVTCYLNILKDFPDIDESEFVMFMIVKANYKFAANSVPNKKAERYNAVVKSFNDFKSKFADSKLTVDVREFEQDSHYQAAVSAFDWAEVCPLDQRETNFNAFFSEVKAQMPFVSDKKEIDRLNLMVEKAHFLIVKYNFQISEERKNSMKLPSLEQTVKTYYIFVDKFPKSRYSKEAERIFNNSTEQIKKLKTNG